MIFVVDAYINYALQGNSNYPNVNHNEYDSIEKITKYLEDDVELPHTGFSKSANKNSELGRIFNLLFQKSIVAAIMLLTHGIVHFIFLHQI